MRTKIKNYFVSLFIAVLILFWLPISFSFAYDYNPHLTHRFITTHHVRPPSILTDAFYVGLGGGYDAYQVREIISTGVSTSATVATRGASGALFGGYGRYFDIFYYGGELSVTGSGASSSFDVITSSASHHHDVNIRVSYAASLLLGVKLTPPTLFYGRIGAVRTLLNTDETIRMGATTLRANDNQWSDGLRFGLGIETSIFCPFSLRVEYSYTSYGTEGTDFGTQYTTSQGQVMLGLIYHFDIIDTK